MAYSKQGRFGDGPSLRTDTIRVVLLGRTGTGKSTLGNTLLQADAFRAEGGLSSTTFTCQWDQCVREGKIWQITDTPGVGGTNQTKEAVLKEVARSMALACPGPHVILFVVRCDCPFTKEIYQAYKTLKEMFGNNIAKYLIVVFTRADILDGETYEERDRTHQRDLLNAPDNLREVLRDAEGRYFTISNVLPDRQRRAEQLCSMMKTLVAQNRNTFLTNDLWARVNNRIEILVQRYQQAHNMDRNDANYAARRAIARDEESSFIRELLPIIASTLTAVLMAVLGRKCSVM